MLHKRGNVGNVGIVGFVGFAVRMKEFFWRDIVLSSVDKLLNIS
jgi:hypothetical protein